MNLINKGSYKSDIVYYKNFIPEDDCKKIVEYFTDPTHPWANVAFYESYGMNLLQDDPLLEKYGLPRNYFEGVVATMKQAVEEAHQRPIKQVSTHAQKWEAGAYASYHSDNSDLNGNPSAWEVSKFVCLLYLNSDYDGGELKFRDHDITIKPEAGILVTFPGGIDNVHAVTEVKNGTRHTIGAFWDYLEAEYSEERRAEWEAEIKAVRERQAAQYEEWAAEDKNASNN
jgi:hypothetical protein